MGKGGRASGLVRVSMTKGDQLNERVNSGVSGHRARSADVRRRLCCTRYNPERETTGDMRTSNEPGCTRRALVSVVSGAERDGASSRPSRWAALEGGVTRV